MTPAEQAAKAIKDATGLDATIVDNWRAEVRRVQTVLQLNPIGSGVWLCSIRATDSNVSSGGLGEGSTPEAALAAVLPRYRAHIAALAADILPGWPRLEWQRKPGWRWSEWALLLVVGGVGCPLLTVGPYRQSSGWWLTYAADPRACVTSGTREKISAAVAAHVESLALPCPLPPFPETPDAT